MLSLEAVLVAGIVPVLAAEAAEEDLVFVIAADMRNFAAAGEEPENFSGACRAITAAGAGALMISPGDLDVDPPSSMESLRDDSLTVPNVVNLGLAGQPVTQALAQFSTEYGSDSESRDRWCEAQIEGRGKTRSSFFRVIVGGERAVVEIYPDDAHGGPYTLMHRVVLN